MPSYLLRNFLPFALVYIAWIWANLDFINARSFVGNDGGYYYHWIIYHFEHLLGGVYPRWDPFHAWGRLDQVQIRLPGEFNPFLLIIPVLLKCQVPPATAYIIYLMTYAGVLFLGFYCLLMLLCADTAIAFLGLVLLVFSAIFNVHLFFQTDLLNIIAPALWLFVFVIGFLRSSTDHELRRSALGMALALMIILTTNLPFYFLTFTLCLLPAVALGAPAAIKAFGVSTLRLLTRQPGLAILIAGLLLMAAYPGFQCFQGIRSPQNILISDRANQSTGNDTGVSLNTINAGALFTQASPEEFFADLSTGAQTYVYASPLIFILILLFVFIPATRRQTVVLTAGFLLFMIMIGNISGLQRVLYDKIPLFHLFRNYFLFWPVLLILLLLFLMDGLKTFLGADLSSPRARNLFITWTVLVHLAFLLFLSSMDNVPLSSFAMTLLSGGWFLAWIIHEPLRRSRTLFLAVLTMISLVSPLHVLRYFHSWDNATAISRDHPLKPMDFHYERPPLSPDDSNKDCYMSLPKVRADDSGFCSSRYYGQRNSYLLKENVPANILSEYVRHKFVLYRQAPDTDDADPDWKKAAAALSSHEGVEFAAANDSRLHVTRFEANRVSLDTSFAQRTFLVYNDSYHDQWRVFIDGRQASLKRANFTFKGVWVEPGRHNVEFVFGSFWEQILYFNLIFVNFGLLLFIIAGYAGPRPDKAKTC